MHTHPCSACIRNEYAFFGNEKTEHGWENKKELGIKSKAKKKKIGSIKRRDMKNQKKNKTKKRKRIRQSTSNSTTITITIIIISSTHSTNTRTCHHIKWFWCCLFFYLLLLVFTGLSRSHWWWPFLHKHSKTHIHFMSNSFLISTFLCAFRPHNNIAFKWCNDDADYHRTQKLRENEFLVCGAVYVNVCFVLYHHDVWYILCMYRHWR